MKSLLLAGVFMASFAVLTPAQEQDRKAQAVQFIELLRQAKIAEAEKTLDSTMKAALPEEKMREIWSGLEAQCGALKSAERTRAEKLAIYDIVYVTCEFERAKLDAKVVFNPAGQISGLFFVPSTSSDLKATPPPYGRTNDFKEIEVTTGAEGWPLPGTLSTPSSGIGPFPGVVLVHGSGPNDRDETVLANKPFRDLAWGLASRGIAVLRYEKRTKVHPQKFMAERVTVKEETMDDALAAVRTLRATKNVLPRHVFLLGHSLGAYLAPRIAQADPSLAGLIMLAPPRRQMEDLMLEQHRYLASLKGELSAEDRARMNELETAVRKVKALSGRDVNSKELVLNAPPSYWLDLRGYDPVGAAKTLKLPMLILQGGRDYQVTTKDFEGWQEALKSQPAVKLNLFPNLNHLFIAGEAKSTPAEYEKPGYVAEEVIAAIADWIKAQN